MPVFFKGRRQLSWHRELKTLKQEPHLLVSQQSLAEHMVLEEQCSPVQSALRGNVITGYLSGHWSF